MENQEIRCWKMQLAVACGLILLVVACRWVIDTPNFQPVMAVALLGGFLFSQRWMGITVVVCAMLVSDWMIGFYEWPLAVVVYSGLALPVLFGPMLRLLPFNPLRLTGNSVIVSVAMAFLFFLSTSLATWCWTNWYPHDWQGLATCLALGLPFLKWTLLGNVVFTTLLFGTYGLAVASRLPGTGRLIPVPVRKQ
jgi:hypothetical protein